MRTLWREVKSSSSMAMKRTNIYQTAEWFEVLHTTKRSQSAVMKLGPGQATGESAEAHESSDQILLLVEGELRAEIGGKRSTIKTGDVVTIPPGVKHRFVNRGEKPAVTFNVYSPPEYPAEESG